MPPPKGRHSFISFYLITLQILTEINLYMHSRTISWNKNMTVWMKGCAFLLFAGHEWLEFPTQLTMIS